MPETDATAREAAFHALFERHHRQVLAYALRRTTTEADAEDVAAETFTVAWRRREEIPPEALPWLYGVARRVLANHRRGHLRGLRLVERLRDWSIDRVGYHSPDATASTATDALGRLRVDDQELLKLIAWEGMTHAEVAATLGISTNAVAIRSHRARGRLAILLGRERELKGSTRSRTQEVPRGSEPDLGYREDTR